MGLGSISKGGLTAYNRILLKALAQAQHHLHPRSVAKSLYLPNLQASTVQTKRSFVHLNMTLKLSLLLTVLS
jgi:hypothetical protein